MSIKEGILEHQKEWLFSAIIFLIAITLRITLAYATYGGGDATNGESFYDFYQNSFDIYSTISPWPYFPFANTFLWVWHQIAGAFDINVNLAYRFFSSFFDALIAILIYFYLLSLGREKALTLSLVYAINPITVLIVSTLSFTDSFALVFLILATLAFELKDSRHKTSWTGFFLAVSISAKPIALVFLPYFLYRSKKISFLISFFISFLILNSYYFIGAPIENIADMLLLIFGKVISGNQFGPLGIGALSAIVGFSTAKLISVLGLLFVAITYVLCIRKNPIDFILIIFSFLLIFRYNFHPQYMAWIVPFAIISQRKILPFLAVGGLALVTVIFDWNASTGAFSLLSFFGLDRINIDSHLVFIYQYLGNPIFLGLGVILSILYLHSGQFYRGQLINFRKALLLLPPIQFKFFYKILLFSFALGFTYLFVMMIIDQLKIGVYLRSLFLVSLPTFFTFYLIYCADVKYKKIAALISVLSFVFMLLISYALLINDYSKPYNAAFIYALILIPLIVYWLFADGGSLQSIVQLRSNSSRVNHSKGLQFIFFIAIASILVLIIFSWTNLHNSASRQFPFSFDNQNFIEKKKYTEVKINEPTDAFLYGNNYIYQLNFDQKITESDLKRIQIKILSESHYLLRVNGKDIDLGYGSFYHMRHSTKRKYYDFGADIIDLTKILKPGINELIFVNNISSPVKPVGISLSLLLDYSNGHSSEIDLTELDWKLNKGLVTKENEIIFTKNLKIQRIEQDELKNPNFMLDTEDIDTLTEKNTVFLAPENASDIKKSILAPVDVFLFVNILLSLFALALLKVGPVRLNQYKR